MYMTSFEIFEFLFLQIYEFTISSKLKNCNVKVLKNKCTSKKWRVLGQHVC